MQFLELLAWYHWIIIACGFFLLHLFKLDGISIPGTFAGIIMAVATSIEPDIYWGWQIWAFVLLTAVTAIPYLRAQQRQREDEKNALPSAADEAAALVGTSITLEEAVASGQDKLLIKGKYWHVASGRDYPAGTRLQVAGHSGAVLNVVSSENPHYGDPGVDSADELSLSEFERDTNFEAEYGRPDFNAWALFQAALKNHSKPSLVQAYHLLQGLRGASLAEAKAKLNTYTTALYDVRKPGCYLDVYPDIYCDTRNYSFFYGEGDWAGADPANFDKDMRKLEAALDTPWADLVRSTIPSEQMDLAMRTLRNSL